MRWDLVENYAYSSRRRHFSVENRGEGKARLMSTIIGYAPNICTNQRTYLLTGKTGVDDRSHL